MVYKCNFLDIKDKSKTLKTMNMTFVPRKDDIISFLDGEDTFSISVKRVQIYYNARVNLISECYIFGDYYK